MTAPDASFRPGGPARRGVPSVFRVPDPTPGTAVPTRSQQIRSGLFALVFAPVALIVMGFAIIDMQAETAIGQPLSSSEGLIGLLISTILLALIAVNSEESSVGMVVVTVCAAIIGCLQLSGVIHAPSFSTAQSMSAMTWSLSPIVVFTTCLGATLAFHDTRCRAIVVGRALDARDDEDTPSSETAHPLDDFSDIFSPGRSHYRERTLVMVGSVLLTCVAIAATVWAAPDDTIAVAAHGLAGMTENSEMRLGGGLLAAVCLGVVAWSSHWSALGSQLVAWLLMIFPSYFILPVWASLTGNVVTPGASALTQLSLAAPTLTAEGLTLSAVTLGVHWARRFLFRQIREALPVTSIGREESPI